jgi:hypothetical protein
VPFNELTLASAARGGHLALCQFLLAEGYLNYERACSAAAQSGHLDVLRFLHESGCYSEKICGSATISGSMEVMQYLRQHGCTLSADVMASATGFGHRQEG